VIWSPSAKNFPGELFVPELKITFYQRFCRKYNFFSSENSFFQFLDKVFFRPGETVKGTDFFMGFGGKVRHNDTRLI
jgi:hypothetical protein